MGGEFRDRRMIIPNPYTVEHGTAVSLSLPENQHHHCLLSHNGCSPTPGKVDTIVLLVSVESLDIQK